MTLDLTQFVNGHFPDIRRYCIGSLGGVLSRCVEHPEKDTDKRNNIDRVTAVEWIDKSPKVVRTLTEKYLLLIGYNKLMDREGKTNKIDIDWVGRVDSEKLDLARNRLSTLRDDEFLTLMPRDFSGLDYRDRFLGRDVWDEFYQPLKLSGDSPIEFLHSLGYTKILYG